MLPFPTRGPTHPPRLFPFTPSSLSLSVFFNLPYLAPPTLSFVSTQPSTLSPTHLDGQNHIPNPYQLEQAQHPSPRAAVSMDAESSSSSSSSQYSPPSLRHKLRTTVCGCFGSPDSSAERLSPPSGGRTRWRRRVAAVGEFRYDPLSYALNFDEGGSDDHGDEGAEAAAYRYRNFSSRLPPSPAPAAARRFTAVAIA